jgi:hypothetical protein
MDRAEKVNDVRCPQKNKKGRKNKPKTQEKRRSNYKDGF